jgi:16S rRNA (cytosine1402-N4)-methyltransferase
MQLEHGERGFSFNKEGPLDMRMDTSAALTAEEIVNAWSEEELGDIFREYGEEPDWKGAAKAIAHYRNKDRITTTKQLSDILVSSLKHRRKKRLHPATLVFQALRICVNRELNAVEEGLTKAIDFLSQGGKVGVLTFHSLEDRIAKTIFKAASKPLTTVKNKYRQAGNPTVPVLRLLTKKPLIPTFEEVRINPRSRSAKLRFATKN